VFWVHASNTDRIEQGYRDIADQVRLAGRNDPKADIFKLVHNWLRNEKNGKWFLVLDNADDAAALTLPADNNPNAQVSSKNGGRKRSLMSYLSQSKNGSVLVTSRTRSVAMQLVDESDILSIGPMDDASGSELLQKKLGEKVGKDGTVELAKALEFMPLALVQAAAYIRQRAPRCSVQQYLEDFHKSDRKRTSLLDYDGGHLRRDEEAKNSILITWQISFDHILRARRSAADLLSLMSFFDRQGIPEELLRGQNRIETRQKSIKDDGAKNTDSDCDSDSDSEDSDSEASVDDGFEEDILTLRNYSFIGITTNATTFDMHRLVQLATRKWLEEHGQLETWKGQYINNLCTASPTGEYEDWAQCQALFPHAKSALLQTPKSQESLEKWAALLYNAAWYAWRNGKVGDAEKLSEKSMKVRVKLLGNEHAATLSSMAMAANAARLAGRWKEAEELGLQAMEIRVRVLGEEHPDTLASISNLASTYSNQGRWKEAEELGLRVMEMSVRVLGEEHPDTLTSMGNLALTYSSQGRWKEAEELGLRVMEIRVRVLGEEHPDTLASISNLASTYSNQGRWKEAEELEVRVLEMRVRVLGEEHPSTLTSMDNLASTYIDQGRWKEAEELGLRVLKMSVRVLGEKHPDTLISMSNLASTYKNQGWWKEAEELGLRVLKMRVRVLGEEHPDTLASMNNLAYTLKSQSRDVEALSLMEACFQLRKKILGEQHPRTKSSLKTLNRWRRRMLR
jgi:UDP-2,3-diacylglucosamine pyrophosphatase LpxH